MQKTIESLKERVRANLLEIQKNQREIRELLKQDVSPERTEKLEERYSVNRLLLAENNDFINVQLTLTNFIEKYGNTNIFEDKLLQNEVLTADECFNMTVSNKMDFDQSHPFYKDEAFFQKLLDHFQKVEDYEKCSNLVKARHKKFGLIG